MIVANARKLRLIGESRKEGDPYLLPLGVVTKAFARFAVQSGILSVIGDFSPSITH